MKTHPSMSLLQKPEILMYFSTLRFQIFLRLIEGQIFIQILVFIKNSVVENNIKVMK